MSNTFSGNIALICPDCSNHLINPAPSGERYHCADCDLRLVRSGDRFTLIRDGEVVDALAVEEVQVTVTWRTLELVPAV